MIFKDIWFTEEGIKGKKKKKKENKITYSPLSFTADSCLYALRNIHHR